MDEKLGKISAVLLYFAALFSLSTSTSNSKNDRIVAARIGVTTRSDVLPAFSYSMIIFSSYAV